jgi:hypothetical protein
MKTAARFQTNDQGIDFVQFAFQRASAAMMAAFVLARRAIQR